MNQMIITAISGLLVVSGTFGSVLPFLPGLPVSYVGLLLYMFFGRSGGISTTNIWGLAVFGVLILITALIDLFAPAVAARGHKASQSGLIGVVLGALLGVFTLGPIGILVGPFVGAFIGEMINSNNTNHALHVAFAALLGLVVSSAFKFIIGLAMMVYFLVLVI